MLESETPKKKPKMATTRIDIDIDIDIDTIDTTPPEVDQQGKKKAFELSSYS